MQSRFTSQNLQQILTFPFKDEKWAYKFVVFTLLTFASILIIPSFFISGYYYEIMRRIIQEGQEPSLPDWDSMEKYFKNGLKIFGVGIIYSLPVILIISLSVFILLSVGLADPDGEGSLALLIGFFLSSSLTMVGSAVGVIIQIISSVAIGHMIANDSFKAAFWFKEWWLIFRLNMGGYFLAYIIVMGISMVINFGMQFLMLTVVLCIALPIFLPAVFAYIGVISNALYAQAYVDGLKALSPQTPETGVQ